MSADIDIEDLRSATAYDQSGVKLGPVGDVYVDDATGRPSWVSVHSGFFGTTAHFAPMAGAHLENGRLILGFAKDTVMSSPKLGEDDQLGVEVEDDLFEHYGLTYESAIAC